MVLDVALASWGCAWGGLSGLGFRALLFLSSLGYGILVRGTLYKGLGDGGVIGWGRGYMFLMLICVGGVRLGVIS